MAKRNRHEDEIGQYASDKFIHRGDRRLRRDRFGTKDLRGDGNVGFHQENVFGQNDRDPDRLEELFGYGEGYVVRRDIVDPVREEDDAAARWLREHDK